MLLLKKVVRDYFANIKNITKHIRVKLYNNSLIFYLKKYDWDNNL